MKLQQWISLLTLIILLLVAGVSGYLWMRSRIVMGLYKNKLVRISDDYRTLQKAYNQAVRETAVTELLVSRDKISVVVRTVEGVVRTVDTPFRAGQDLYVDYVLLNNRLWIRRVFDDATPPANGVVIDPQLADIDWDMQDVSYGKAIYKRLNEGRWIVSVTGNGSLGLKRCSEAVPVNLHATPAVRTYEEIQEDLQQNITTVNVRDVFRAFLGAN